MVFLGKLSDDICLTCGAAAHGEDVPHRRTDPDPVDLSWVTTEPVYEGPKWMHRVKFVGAIVAFGFLAASAAAVLVK